MWPPDSVRFSSMTTSRPGCEREQIDATPRVFPVSELLGDDQQVISQHLDVIAQDALQALAFPDGQVSERLWLVLDKLLARHLEQGHGYLSGRRGRSGLAAHAVDRLAELAHRGRQPSSISSRLRNARGSPPGVRLCRHRPGAPGSMPLGRLLSASKLMSSQVGGTSGPARHRLAAVWFCPLSSRPLVRVLLGASHLRRSRPDLDPRRQVAPLNRACPCHGRATHVGCIEFGAGAFGNRVGE